ncbi:MAG: hypothetical protein K2X27_15910 [Candidatus Obscuribacterales bacterium]|nr:hypothetical protein [Candidatus Obscuribacterales bacterium]
MPEVTQTAGGFATEVDLDAPTQPSTAAAPDASNAGGKSFMDLVPQDYSQKDWVANLSKSQDPVGEMFKQFDNQLSLIGRKAEGLRVPGEGATPDDWNNFHKAIGVPETPDKYEYQAPQVDEKLKPYFATDDNLINTMKQAALKAGVRPEGFKHLAEAFDNYYLAELQKSVDSFGQTMSKLENNFKQKFGERSNQVLDGWKQSLAGTVSKEQMAVIESLDPTVKLVLAEQYDSFSKKYVREDNLNLDVPAQPAGMSQAQYGEEYAKAFANLRRTAPGSSEHLEAKRAYENLRAKGAQLFDK